MQMTYRVHATLVNGFGAVDRSRQLHGQRSQSDLDVEESLHVPRQSTVIDRNRVVVKRLQTECAAKWL